MITITIKIEEIGHGKVADSWAVEYSNPTELELRDRNILITMIETIGAIMIKKHSKNGFMLDGAGVTPEMVNAAIERARSA